MAKLFIEDTSLIAIGDALRGHFGDTKNGGSGTATALPRVAKMNASSFDSLDGESWYTDNVLMQTIKLGGASYMVFDIAIQTCNTSEYVWIAEGSYASVDSSIGTTLTSANTITRQQIKLEGDTLTVGIYFPTSHTTHGFYGEVRAYNELGEELEYYYTDTVQVENTYTPAQMATAIGLLNYGESGGITPEGELAITENGSYDVTNYASAAVNVPVGVFPEGTLEITANGEQDVTNYASVNVNVASSGSDESSMWESLMVIGTIGRGKYLTDYTTKALNLRQYAFTDVVDIRGSFNVPNAQAIPTYCFYRSGNGDYPYTFNSNAVSASAYAFSYANINNYNLPYLETIYTQAFSYNLKLTEITLPMAWQIYGQAFYGSSALTKVDLGEYCISIGSRAFYNCSALETLIIRNSTSDCSLSDVSVFNGTKIASGTGYIYVPKAKLEYFTSDSKWGTFAAQIRAIEDYPDICG